MARKKKVVCPDCEAGLDRRRFLGTVGAAAAAAAAGGIPLFATAKAHANPTPKSVAETAVKALYDSLDDKQRKEVCFDWDYKDSRGLLRTRVSNNWQITKPHIDSDFFTKKQKDLCFDIFKGIFNPDWHEKLLKQLKDDSGGEFGKGQSIAIFGKPGDGKFEFVMTGRHLTCRADGDSEAHVAFGGPIFHGHCATDTGGGGGGTEKVGHPGNVFWHQALQANKVFKMFDKDQQEKALITKRPAEQAVPFRGKDKEVKYPGLPAKEMSGDQKKELQKVLLALIEPYRKEDIEEVEACLKAQGGLEACSLALYKEGRQKDDDDSPYDNWRLEGPTFVWYFRGTPHVHIWINVADDPSVELNS